MKKNVKIKELQAQNKSLKQNNKIIKQSSISRKEIYNEDIKKVKRMRKKTVAANRVIKRKNENLSHSIYQGKQKIAKMNDIVLELEEENNCLYQENECIKSFIISKIKLNIPGKKAWVWPLDIIQIILEQLHNCTKPSAIPLNIESQARLLMSNKDIIVKELPSLQYFRRFRGELRIIGEIMAVYRLSKQPKWYQLLTDSTTRQQVHLSSLFISTKEDNELQALVLTSAHIGIRETSKEEVSSILQIITNAKLRLQQWIEFIKNIYL